MIKKVWNSIPKYVPSIITNRIEMSFIWWLYFEIQYKLINLSSQNFHSPCGEINIHIPDRIKYDSQYEPILSEELCDSLGSESIFFDIGSGFGYFIELAKEAGVKDANIHGFEASPRRYLITKRNCGSNINITPRFVGKKTTNRSISVDEYRKENQRPDVVKIDVEGSEFDVLNGMRETISEDPPLIFLEVHPRYLSQQNIPIPNLLDFLFQHNYSVAVIDHRDDEKNWKLLENPEQINDFDLPKKTYLLRARPPL